jgi:hypothetical protein
MWEQKCEGDDSDQRPFTYCGQLSRQLSLQSFSCTSVFMASDKGVQVLRTDFFAAGDQLYPSALA